MKITQQSLVPFVISHFYYLHKKEKKKTAASCG
jgi:hypothetical protein